MELLSMRPFYQPSGKLVTEQFVLWSVIACAAAALLGGLSFGAYKIGFYLVVLLPLGAGFVIGGVSYLMVRGSHCRNYRAATITSIAATICFFVAQFYTGMVYELGGTAAHRVDLLPRYINARMAADVIGKGSMNLGDTKTPRDPEPAPVVNWIFFVLQVFAFHFGTVALGWYAVRQPYSENQQRWMSVKTKRFQGVSAEELRDAMSAGSAAKLLRKLQETTTLEPGNLVLKAYYCDVIQNREKPAEMYVVVGRITDKMNAQGKPVQESLTLPLELAEDEIGLLLPLLETSPEWKRKSPFVKDLTGINPALTIDADQQWWITLRSLAFLVVLVAILVGIVGYAISLAWSRDAREETWRVMIAMGAMIVMLPCIGIYEVWIRRVLKNVMLKHRLVEAVAKRNGVLFDPTGDDVVLIEQRSIGDVSDPATRVQVGLLFIDSERGEVRMEGAKEKWRIPLTMMVKTEIVPYLDGSDSRFLNAIEANDRQGHDFVATFQVMPTVIHMPTKNRSRAIAESLREQLLTANQRKGAPAVAAG